MRSRDYGMASQPKIMVQDNFTGREPIDIQMKSFNPFLNDKELVSNKKLMKRVKKKEAIKDAY